MFFSVDIGDLSTVHGWRHYGDSQPGKIYKDWTQSQPHISDTQGFSQFAVTPVDSELLAVRLISKSVNNSLESCLFRHIRLIIVLTPRLIETLKS